MRFNLARKYSGLSEKFIKENIRGFMEEYGFPNLRASMEYVTDGQQGLTAFVEYLNKVGYSADMYYLKPNRDLFSDVGDRWESVSRTSPSFGFTIADDDPLLVEFKIRNA